MSALLHTLASAPPASSLTAEEVAGAAETTAERAYTLLEALPGEAHITMGIALVAGLVLWLYGSRLIKPMFGVLGVAAGGLVGLLVPPLLGIDAVGGIAGWLIGLGVGAVVGLVVALVILKIAVTFTAGLAFAVAGFLGALVYLQVTPDPAATDGVSPGEAPPTSALVEARERSSALRDGPRLFIHPISGQPVTLRQLIESTEGDAEHDPDAPPPETTEERIAVLAVRARAVVLEAWDFAADEWEALPVRSRMIMLGSVSTTFALGLLCGLLLPKRSAAFVTALLGSALWLTAAVWLIEGVPQLSGVRPLVEGRSATVWAVVWGVVAIIGVAAQIGGLAREKRGSQGGDDE